MSKTEVSGKQIKDGSIELVDLSNAVATDISTLKSDVATLQTDVAAKADAGNLASVATSGSYNDLSDKPSIPSVAGLASETYVDTAVAGKADSASLATVATSGSYADLSNKPTLFSGSYADLSNKPSIPSSIDDLSDVTLSSPTAGQVLEYNGTAWVNAEPAAGGGGGLTSVNGLTGASQDFATGTSGSDFGISSTGTTHTFNIPNASASARGLVTTNTQTFGGDKSFDGTTHGKRFTETSVNAFSTSLAVSSGTLTIDTSVGTCVLGALNAAVTTWDFTNVPTENNKATTVTVILVGNSAFTYGDACNVNGSAVTTGVRWPGNNTPTASSSNTDIITFIIVRDSAGTVRVFGSGATNFQ